MPAPDDSPRGTRRATVFLALAIFAISLALRLFGIGWGLRNDLHNQSYHPDEPIIFDFIHKSGIFVHPVSTYRQTASDRYYSYGSLFLAVNRVADAMASTYGGASEPPTLDRQSIHSSQDWDALNAHISQCQLAGRIVSAIAGAATAALVFLIALMWFGRLASLAAGLAIAFSPDHVMHSRFQTVDILACFFVALATWGCLRLLFRENWNSKQTWTAVAVAGVFVGFAAATRYSAAIMIL